jgi:hypothetical protein
VLPSFDPGTGYLPAGIHPAGEAEIQVRLGSANEERRRLFAQLQRLLGASRRIGASRLFIDGSFVTDKERLVGKPPNDIDCVVWLPPTIEALVKDADTDAMFIFGLHQTRKVGPLDLYPVLDQTGWDTWVEFFGSDQQGVPKGVVEVT